MNPLALGGIVQAVGQIADDLITSDKERLDAEIELRKLGIEERRIEQASALAQLDVNKAEASHLSVFVAGWRPWVGWVCGMSLAYVGLLEPIARFIAKVCFGYVGEFPIINTDLTEQLLFGLLGVAGLRTYEKKVGVAK